MAPRPAHALAALLLADLCTLAIGGASAQNFDEQHEIAEGAHFALEIRRPVDAPWFIHIDWNSQIRIDAWLLDAENYTRYLQRGEFKFHLEQVGGFNTVNFVVNGSLIAKEPFYLVLDNTESGTNPPYGLARTFLRGYTEPVEPQPAAPTQSTSPPPGPDGLSMAGSILLPVLILAAIFAVPTVLVVALMKRREREAARLETLNQAVWLGQMVGRPSASRPVPAAVVASTAATSCRFCGQAALGSTRFCTSCGAPRG